MVVFIKDGTKLIAIYNYTITTRLCSYTVKVTRSYHGYIIFHFIITTITTPMTHFSSLVSHLLYGGRPDFFHTATRYPLKKRQIVNCRWHHLNHTNLGMTSTDVLGSFRLQIIRPTQSELKDSTEI